MKYPSKYRYAVRADELEGEKYTLIQTDADLNFWLDFVSIPEEFRQDITGAIVLTGDGDLISMWLTEDSAWYSCDAAYHPLPYYAEVSMDQGNIPEYWLPTNEEYWI